MNSVFKNFAKKISLPKGVFIIAIWSLLVGLSNHMIYSQLGMFLKYHMHADVLQIALFDGIVEFISNITRIFAGVVSDFIMNRKNVLLVGLAFSILIKPFFIIANSVVTLFVVQSLDRFFNGIQVSPRDALIADITQNDQRGKAYGLNRTLKTVGALAGIAIAVAIIYVFPEKYEIVFSCALIPAFLAFILLLLKIKEKSEYKIFQNFLRLNSIALLGKNFWRLMLFIWLIELSHFSDSLFCLKANEYASPAIASLAAMFMTLGQVSFAYPAGLYLNRIGTAKYIKICICMIISANVLLFFAKSAAFVFLGAVLWGGQMSALVILFLSLVGNSVNERLRATAIGIYYAVSGLGYMIAGTIAGNFWDKFGSDMVFLYSLSICSFCLLLLNKFFKDLK